MMDLRGTQGTYLEGVVTKQLPAAGSSVERLAKVQLQIATQTVSVPTLVGNTLNFALTSLDKSGLRLGTASSNFVDDAKPGTIVSQTPEAGKSVPAGTAVDVLVASAVRPTPRRGP